MDTFVPSVRPPHSSDFGHICAPYPLSCTHSSCNLLLSELGLQFHRGVSGCHTEGTIGVEVYKRPHARQFHSQEFEVGPSPNLPLSPRQRQFHRQFQVVSMCSCSAWCMIASRVSKSYICRLLMPRCFWEHWCEPEISRFKHFLVFACLWERGRRLRCTHTMHSLTCVSVVVCVMRKPRPCPSYSRHRDYIDLGLLYS